MSTNFIDSITSAVTSLGRLFKDKSVGRSFTPTWAGEQELVDLYEHNGLAATAVDAVVDDVFGAGWEISSDVDDEIDARTQKQWRRLGLTQAMQEAWKLARVVGGAGVFLGPPGGSAVESMWSKPPPSGIGIGFVSILSPTTASVTIEMNPLSLRYLQPAMYRVGSVDVHPGWVLHFSGGRSVSTLSRGNHTQWGRSVLQQIWDPLLAYLAAAQALSHCIEEIKETTFSVPGLMERAANPEALAALKARVELMRRVGGNTGVRILDAQENWSTVYGSLTGFSDALDPLALHLCAVARTPMSRMFGRGAAGLANQTESDRENWEEHCRGQANAVLGPNLEKALRRTLSHQDFEIKFNPLRTHTASEIATQELSEAQSDTMRIADGILTPAEVRRSRFVGDHRWQLDEDYVPPSPGEGLIDEDGLYEEDEAAAEPEIEISSEAPPNGEVPVSVQAAAAQLGRGAGTIRGLMRAGKLEHVYRTGAGYSVLMSEVYKAARYTPPTEEDTI